MPSIDPSDVGFLEQWLESTSCCSKRFQKAELLVSQIRASRFRLPPLSEENMSAGLLNDFGLIHPEPLLGDPAHGQTPPENALLGWERKARRGDEVKMMT